MGRKMFVMLIGLGLILLGIFTKVPGEKLWRYSSNSGEYSHIEEYVGGDAYNYIIGASLVGAKITGTQVQKAIYISSGLLILCIGIIFPTKRVLKIVKTEETDSQTNSDDPKKETDPQTDYNDAEKEADPQTDYDDPDRCFLIDEDEQQVQPTQKPMLFQGKLWEDVRTEERDQ